MVTGSSSDSDISIISSLLLQTKVTITNARNLQLHLSYNGMVNSEAEIEIEKAFNSTVHLSFQVMERRIFCLVLSALVLLDSNHCRTPGILL